MHSSRVHAGVSSMHSPYSAVYNGNSSPSVLASAGRSVSGAQSHGPPSQPPFSLAAGLAELHRREADAAARRQLHEQLLLPDTRTSAGGGRYGETSFGGGTGAAPPLGTQRTSLARPHRFHSDLHQRAPAGWFSAREVSRESKERASPFSAAAAASSELESSPFYTQLAAQAGVSPFAPPPSSSKTKKSTPSSTSRRRRSPPSKQPHSARSAEQQPQVYQLHTPQQLPPQQPQQRTQLWQLHAPQQPSVARLPSDSTVAPSSSYDPLTHAIDEPPPRIVHMPSRRGGGTDAAWTGIPPADSSSSSANSVVDDALLSQCLSLLSSPSCPLLRLASASPLERDDVRAVLCALQGRPTTQQRQQLPAVQHQAAMNLVRSFARSGYAFWPAAVPSSSPNGNKTSSPSRSTAADGQTPLALPKHAQLTWLCNGLRESAALRDNLLRFLQSQSSSSNSGCMLFGSSHDNYAAALPFDSAELQSLLESCSLALRLSLGCLDASARSGAEGLSATATASIFRGMEFERRVARELHLLNESVRHGKVAPLVRIEQLVAALADALKPDAMERSPQQNDPLAPPSQPYVASLSAGLAPSSPQRQQHLPRVPSSAVLSPPPVLAKESLAFPTWPSLDSAKDRVRHLQPHSHVAAQMSSKEQWTSPPLSALVGGGLGANSSGVGGTGSAASRHPRAVIASPSLDAAGVAAAPPHHHGGSRSTNLSRTISPRSAQRMVRSFAPSHRPSPSTLSSTSEAEAGTEQRPTWNQSGKLHRQQPSQHMQPTPEQHDEQLQQQQQPQSDREDHTEHEDLRRRVAEQQVLIENLEAALALAQAEKANPAAHAISSPVHRAAVPSLNAGSPQQQSAQPHLPVQPQRSVSQLSADVLTPRRGPQAATAFPLLSTLALSSSSSAIGGGVVLGVPVDAAASLAAQRSTLRIQQARLDRLREELEAEKARVVAKQHRRDPSMLKPAVPMQPHPPQQFQQQQPPPQQQSQGLGRSPSISSLLQHSPGKQSRIPQLREDLSPSRSAVPPQQQQHQPQPLQQQQLIHAALAPHSITEHSPPKSARQLVAAQQAREQQGEHELMPASASAVPRALAYAPALPAATEKSKSLQRKLLRMHLYHNGSALFSEDLLHSGALHFPPSPSHSWTDAQIDALLAVDANGLPYGPQAAQHAMALVDRVARRKRPLDSLEALIAAMEAERQLA